MPNEFTLPNYFTLDATMLQNSFMGSLQTMQNSMALPSRLLIQTHHSKTELQSITIKPSTPCHVQCYLMLTFLTGSGPLLSKQQSILKISFLTILYHLNLLHTCDGLATNCLSATFVLSVPIASPKLFLDATHYPNLTHVVRKGDTWVMHKTHLGSYSGIQKLELLKFAMT